MAGFMGAFRLHVSRSLEDGRWDGALSRALALAWAAAAKRSVVRKATLPSSIERAYCVGGATLGGSGKTRVSIALARRLSEQGKRVALIAHGYRARVATATVVKGDESLEEVGDEALLCARALSKVTPVNVNVNVNVPRSLVLGTCRLLQVGRPVLDFLARA
jgi:tetraacyldisaccharide-1-P 4'-kinase